MNILEYVYLLAPAITGFGASLICKMDEDSGKSVKFRPPAWVFGVVWPILYILLGLSWVVASRKDVVNSVYYSLLTALLVTWIFVYSCNNDKKNAVFVLLASVMTAIACFSVGSKKSRLLISPLIGWLLFAMLMNATEIQQSID